MHLHDYFRILLRNWILILSVVVLAVGAAATYSALAPRQYESVSRVFVATKTTGTVQDLSQGTAFSQQVAQSYAIVATSPIVLETVVRDLKLSTTPEALARQVKATAATGNVVMEIAATSSTAAESAAIANAVSATLVTVVGDLTPGAQDGTTPVKITQIQKATPPSSPVSPKIPLNLALGALSGIAVAAILVALREVLNVRLRGRRDVELATGEPILGSIAFDAAAKTAPLMVHSDPFGVRAESFRSLRTNLQFLDIGRGSRSIVITSSNESEGKTTTAANLAIAVAATDSRVVVVDADLRRPKLAEYFGLDGSVGLTDVLIGRVTLDQALQAWGDAGLQVLPAGAIPPNPNELLQSDAMIEVLAELELRFGTVLLDTPPVLPVSDAAILGARSSGVILVCAVGRGLTRQQLQRALATVSQVNARVLGLIVTMLPTKGADAVTTQRYGYEPAARPAAPASRAATAHRN